MARGWESKDVESQMEDAREARSLHASRPNLEELKLAKDREALLLQRTRVLADLETAVKPGYREILRRSLEFLDEKLAALNGPARPD